jgi:hypothetical protein
MISISGVYLLKEDLELIRPPERASAEDTGDGGVAGRWGYNSERPSWASPPNAERAA